VSERRCGDGASLILVAETTPNRRVRDHGCILAEMDGALLEEPA